MNLIVSPMIIPIARWSLWEPGVLPDGSASSPDVGFVEPLLRRRLSSLARMTLRVAYDCAHDIANVRFVYASRHGELSRTTTMLESIAEKEELSPTVFSLSVLNASAGLFSMLQKNAAPSSAISAGRSSFCYGLMEASLQLAANPEQSVLFVYADEPAPAMYGAVDSPLSGRHAVGMLLQSSADLRIRCSTSAEDSVPEHEDLIEDPSRAFLRCLGPDQAEAHWQGDGKKWCWTRERQ